MADNLIFSLNATIPLFLLILLGMGLRKLGWVDKAFAGKLNSFVFRVSLPLMLFHDLATVDFREAWNAKFVLFCFGVTLLSIVISALLAGRMKDRRIRGEFIQASCRSSSAILGIAFIQNIYGSSGMAPLMIIASVPLYNIMAVTVLNLYHPDRAGRIDGETLAKTGKGIATNPIILGILAGAVWSLLGLPMPTFFDKFLSSVGNTASPIGLIAMGASSETGAMKKQLLPGSLAVFMKLFGFCLIFLPCAIALGFRREELIAILVMLGSAATVAGYVMAKNMGHDGDLSSFAVTMTTFLCPFSLALWLFLLRTWEYI